MNAITQGGDLSVVTPEEVMGCVPVVVNPQDSLDRVLKTMVDYKLSRVPVVHARHLIGTVSRADVLHYAIAPETSRARTLPVCYWCEQVRDVRDVEVWCELPYFFLKHQFGCEGVSLAPTYCPRCLKLVKMVMDGHENKVPSQPNSKGGRKQILVVDDEQAITVFLQDALQVLGFEVVIAHNGRNGLQILERMKVDGVLLDMDMPIMDGRTMLDELRWRGYAMPVIVMSGGTDEPTLRACIQEGAQDFLMKPFDIRPLQKVCQRVFEGRNEHSPAVSQLSPVS